MLFRWIVVAIVAVGLVPGARATPEATPVARVTHEMRQREETGVAAGEFRRIYDPSVEGEAPLAQGPAGEWSWNDHTLVQGPDGAWHAFGITDPPVPGSIPSSFGHATSPELMVDWTGLPHALTATAADTGPGEPGEEWIWAPHVVEHEGTYYMFFAGPVIDAPNPHQRYKIQLATSTDLETWTRYDGNPLFEDGFDGRDPMVLRVGEEWVMYYTATSDPTGGKHIVAYRTSADLLTWSERKVAFEHPGEGTFAGPTESPFVVEHDGAWYLFTCCGDGVSYLADYTVTNVYRSDDPLHFSYDQKIGTIDAHAAEVVRDADGQFFISSAGFRQGGLYLAPLEFEAAWPVEERVIATDAYRLTLQTSPRTLITSLEVDPDGDGLFTPVLDNDYRGTGPYGSFDTYGNTDAPGVAASVEVSEDGTRLDLTGIPIGPESVTVDWSFRFAAETFDMTFAWHIDAAFAGQVVEMAWYMDTALPVLGDATFPDLADGDVDDGRNVKTGFPEWMMATGDNVTLVAAYAPGSTLLEGARYAWNPGGTLVWQLVPKPVPIADASFEGGQWRIGASGTANDAEFADSLVESLTASRSGG